MESSRVLCVSYCCAFYYNLARERICKLSNKIEEFKISHLSFIRQLLIIYSLIVLLLISPEEMESL